MRFVCEIDLEDPFFEEDIHQPLARLMEKIKQQVKQGSTGKKVVTDDKEQRKLGQWAFQPDRED
jgi:hypothetical protein